MNNKDSIISDIVLTIFILFFSTVLGIVIRDFNLHETNVVVVYLLSVLLVARFTRGYVYGIAASIISLLLFNWFFTEPYFTLKVYDLTYIITFSIMMITSIITSTLTTKVKKSAFDAKERENESNALYQMMNQLTDAEDAHAIAKIMVTTTSEILGCNTSCICFDESGFPEKSFLQYKGDGWVIYRELNNPNDVKCRMEKLNGCVDISDEYYFYPIYGKKEILAVLRIPKENGVEMTQSQNRMLHSIIESAALALERLRSLQEEAKSREETMQERYRGNLLRAISHDIRTPLSGIMGTSEMLMNTTEKNDPRYALEKDIYQDAQWLHALVENILNLTKLQDGKMVLDKQLEVLEEVIGAAVLLMEKRFPHRNIDVQIPDSVLMVPMDAKLISQVLINLIDNADKHTPVEESISVSVQDEKHFVSVSVSDRGNGISAQDLPNIFQMFYTTSGISSDSRRGVGLGLSICQSIIEAHGGSIRAENRDGGGAVFTFTLPMEENL